MCETVPFSISQCFHRANHGHCRNGSMQPIVSLSKSKASRLLLWISLVGGRNLSRFEGWVDYFRDIGANMWKQHVCKRVNCREQLFKKKWKTDVFQTNNVLKKHTVTPRLIAVLTCFTKFHHVMVFFHIFSHRFFPSVCKKWLVTWILRILRIPTLLRGEVLVAFPCSGSLLRWGHPSTMSSSYVSRWRPWPHKITALQRLVAQSHHWIPLGTEKKHHDFLMVPDICQLLMAPWWWWCWKYLKICCNNLEHV